MKYTVCYPAGHTRTIEFGGMSWTPGELVEFEKMADIPDVVMADRRFEVVATKDTPTQPKKKPKASVVPPPVDNDPTEPEA